MNRCDSTRRAVLRATAAAACTPPLAGLFTATPAAAQVLRLFPPNALRGELIGTAPPDVLVNGKPARLAPGARIRNPQNRFDVIGMLHGERVLVHYTVDAGGQLLDIWILTAAEAANRPWPTTREEAEKWTFDPVAQTWSKP